MKKSHPEMTCLDNIKLGDNREVTNYLFKLKDIFIEACEKGIWVSIEENKKTQYNYVKVLIEPTHDQILTQLTTAQVGNHGNVSITNIKNADSLVKRLSPKIFNSSVRLVDRTTVSIVGEFGFMTREEFEKFAMSDHYRHFKFNSCKLIRVCEKRNIRINVIHKSTNSLTVEKVSGVYQMVIGDYSWTN